MGDARQPPDYVHFKDDQCSGCALCVKECPTKAIRLRDHQHIRFVDQCIGCGECIRVCPMGAAVLKSVAADLIEQEEFNIAVVSPLLYTQFPGVMPGIVRQGLKNMGFERIIDLSPYVEMAQVATEIHIQRVRSRKGARWPLISPFCPVVLRLIGYRFPELLPNILPFMGPNSLLSSVIPDAIVTHIETTDRPVIFYHITPCPVSGGGSDPLRATTSTWTERFLGINTIYPRLLQEIEKLLGPPAEDAPNAAPKMPKDKFFRGRALLWGVSGGEISGMNLDRAIAVSGLKETIRYLEKIEIGQFRDMTYFEFRTCPEGCIGGPFMALDKYIAKAGVLKMVRTHGFGRPLSRETIAKRYNQGWFYSSRRPAERAGLLKRNKTVLSIQALHQIENLLSRIRGKDCAACGAPDCRTFAEDVVRGQVSVDDCLILNARKGTT